MKRLLCMAFTLLLAGCGTLPQPLLGKPGAEGARLAVPPPPVLVIPPSPATLLGSNGSKAYAHALAHALDDQNVPAMVRTPRNYDWELLATATTSAGLTTPDFKIIGPNHKIYGHLTGQPVDATRWAEDDPATIAHAATSAAPRLARQLAAINASVQQSNPASLENRPPQVMLLGVTGAPGDGDHALKLDLSRTLPRQGIVMVKDKSDADFLVSGRVRVSPLDKTNRDTENKLVELDWTVKDRRGNFVGKVSQLHDLKSSEMAPYWGDVAAAAAQQAALGLKQVIRNATLRHDAAAKTGNKLRKDPITVQQP
ncbi:MAG TPA: hypothetical protein PLV07_06225 [Acidiphilium sp.]|uniref:hypothetical protein n=1 Tax=unclassified Acidiphilium TaxID=2617493 RepID=UPI000BC97170|nr:MULTISPECIES: hypothetical protein [unclassified Acidiphilium]OYV55523.1 MAG: hypothetical protein B7Z76_10215 [Acidiphilium sp. 20-67-58]OYV66367.1 MAG: hypothetical protein B7X09_03820 [Acidiphilium sp. 21-66-27]HQT61734.1 hypothetical protein [Acidiphilium sp.]HQU11160.1 hypothetical protein [Acidiphilium sp.]